MDQGSGPDSAGIRVLIADDEKLVRAALRSYLAQESDIEVVGEALDGDDAVRQAEALQPDVVLMDLQMPGADGIEATRRIVDNGNASRVLVVTAHVADAFVTDSLLAGASGYLVKDADPAQVVEAVRGVHDGGRPIDPTVTHHLIDELRRRNLPATVREEVNAADPGIEITNRERDVLEALCAGKSNREIASNLYISEPTVKYYLTGLMRKFNSRGRVELVVSAIRNGVVR